MTIRSMMDHACRFKDAGTRVRACLSRLAGREFDCITTGAMSRWFICLSKAVTWAKLTVPNSWDNGVSEWEAAAMRKHDREKAKAAASRHSEVRTGIQEEIETTKKQRRRATREREKARQLDRQREEIHPSQVLSELESLRPPPPRVCTCQRPNLIPTRSIQCSFCPFVYSRRRSTHEASSSASLRGLHRNPL